MREFSGTRLPPVGTAAGSVSTAGPFTVAQVERLLVIQALEYGEESRHHQECVVIKDHHEAEGPASGAIGMEDALHGLVVSGCTCPKVAAPHAEIALRKSDCPRVAGVDVVVHQVWHIAQPGPLRQTQPLICFRIWISPDDDQQIGHTQPYSTGWKPHHAVIEQGGREVRMHGWCEWCRVSVYNWTVQNNTT